MSGIHGVPCAYPNNFLTQFIPDLTLSTALDNNDLLPVVVVFLGVVVEVLVEVLVVSIVISAISSSVIVDDCVCVILFIIL